MSSATKGDTHHNVVRTHELLLDIGSCIVRHTSVVRMSIESIFPQEGTHDIRLIMCLDVDYRGSFVFPQEVFESWNFLLSRGERSSE